MAVDTPEYDDDEIVTNLELSREPRPNVPPMDVVLGHFQKNGNNIRLYLEDWTRYMEFPKGRLVVKGKGSRNRSQLHVRADGNYEQEVIIGTTSQGPPAETEGAEPTYLYSYSGYVYAKTTPWHE